ncbi:MAG TPA: hypothetical protein ENO22_01900 [candidate division Zixibacteria bacterium]|nr:hypothetical protein [candidate division Zixibacteria bacterium]
MNKRHHYQAFVCLLLIIFLPAESYSYLHEKAMDEKDIQTPSRLIVKVKPLEVNSSGQGASDLNKVTGKTSLDKKYGITDTKLLFAGKSAGSANDLLSRIYILECPRNTDLESAAREYEALEDIEYAHPDYLLELYLPPNDTHYGIQWPLNNVGQGYPHVLRRDGDYNDTLITMYGTAGADINALEVFENPPDNTALVIIAVIDTGVDMDHPELAGRIWQNPGEIPDNGIDDDHNGYVDDIRGWDYTSGFGAPTVPDNDPSDSYGHGTHCSGIIASLTDNSSGIGGIVSDCKIMPLKFYPVMLSSYAAAAIVYAADNGADVISMSFGYPWQVEVLEDALEYARSKGVVPCAATGNDGIAFSNYPGAYPSVISVGASTSDDEVAFFSTYGEQMDVVAPGYSVLSLRAAGTDMYAPSEPNVHIIDENYYVASGTSMACPHAAAVAAYMMSASPGLTPDAVQQIMQNTADDVLDPYGGGLNLPGWDQYSGHGRINLENALAAVPAITARITSPLPNEILAGEIDVSGSAAGDDFTEYTLEYGIGSSPVSWTTITNSTSPVSDAVLGTFNTAGLNGSFTIRLRVGEDNSDQVTVNVANDIVAYISAPLEDDTVISRVKIYGSATCPGFSHYSLEYKAISGSVWNQFGQSAIPVKDDFLGEWKASALETANYHLRLSLYSDSGVVAQDTVEVYLEHILAQEGNWKIEVANQISTVLNYGDFDNDAVNEIVVGTASGIKFYTPEGTEKTDGMPQPPAYNFRIPPAVGDLNGDGLDDLVAVGKSGTAGKLYAHISNGQSFTTTLLAVPNVSAYDQQSIQLFPVIFLKDIDSDDKDEIFFYEPPDCWIYDSDGSLIMRIPAPGLGSFCQYLSNDSDGDGMDELYASHQTLYQFDADGVVLDSFDLTMDIAMNCDTRGISAVDIDSDDKREIIVYVAMSDTQETYWVYAFDEGLALKDGWPHNTGINTFLVPPAPIFGDLDRDGAPDYFSAFYELVHCMIYGWKIDGSTYIPGSGTPLFATPENPGEMITCIMADIEGDSRPEIIAEVKADIFLSYDIERLMAWDYLGNPLAGWPIVVRQQDQPIENFGIATPTVGDISGDGYVDMLFSTSLNEVLFLSFDVPHNPNYSPVPMWRYNRRLNNLSSLSIDFACGDTDGSGAVNISDAVLLINYIFLGGAAPVQFNIADTNCDGTVNLSDAVFIINYVFIEGFDPCDVNGDGIPDC